MTMTKLALTAAALLVSVPAFADPITFKDPAGVVWTVTEGGNGADISKLYMSADAATACPGHRIKLEASKLGPAMTKDQKFRGDQRWHIVCDRTPVQQQRAAEQPVAPTQPAPVPQAQAQRLPETPRAGVPADRPRTYFIRALLPDEERI